MISLISDYRRITANLMENLLVIFLDNGSVIPSHRSLLQLTAEAEADPLPLQEGSPQEALSTWSEFPVTDTGTQASQTNLPLNQAPHSLEPGICPGKAKINTNEDKNLIKIKFNINRHTNLIIYPFLEK